MVYFTLTMYFYDVGLTFQRTTRVIRCNFIYLLNFSILRCFSEAYTVKITLQFFV